MTTSAQTALGRFALPLLLLVLSIGILSPSAAVAEDRVFELRTYYAAEGKLDALNARFRDHTIRIFEKHGMDVLGFWEPIDPEKGKGTQLIYMLAFPSEEARANSWKAFGQDPEWKKVAEESQKNGRLITKIDSVLMSPTDYSSVK